jgi:Flp pilus assembly pilin Flp
MLTSTYNHSIWWRNRIVDALKRHAAEDRGAALVEYAFLLVLIVVVCIAAVTFLGTNNSASATDSANKLAAAN